MKLTVLRENLLKGLGVVERSVGEGERLPILGTVKIEAGKGNAITLATTNLETAIIHTCSGKVVQEGTAAVSLHVLRDILKNLTTEKIQLTAADRKLSMQADNYEASVSLEKVDEFPLIPPVQNRNESATFAARILKRLFMKSLVATQYSEIRPEINGIYTSFGDEGIVCAGTDSFRLVEARARRDTFQSGFQQGVSFIVPLRAVGIFIRSFADEENIQLFLDANQIIFESAATTLVSRLIDGTFPSYRDIIPKETEQEVQVRREELENALKVARVFSGRANDVSVSLDEEGKLLEISSRESSVGENVYRLPARSHGAKKEITILFNWKYLLDGVSLYEKPEVVLGASGPHKPVVIRGKDEEDMVYVVMPIRE